MSFKRIKPALILIFSLSVILGLSVVRAEAATNSPKLSKSGIIKISDKKNIKVDLKNAGTAKVRWIIKEDSFSKKDRSSAVKIIKKNNKNIVLKPVHNGLGVLTCKVGKKSLKLN